MSSSAPKLQRQAAAAPEPSPFVYTEAQPDPESAGSADQTVEERMRRLETEAFERGRQEAEQQWRASAEAAASSSRGQVLRAVGEFARERSVYYARIEGEVVQLALAIARKILHREAQIDPYALQGIVRVTLDKLDAGTRVDLHVPPREAAEWRHYFASQPEGTAVPEVHEDPALPAGGCRVETSLGATEIGLESQLKEIETGLLDLLAQRPDGKMADPAAAALGGASATSRETGR